MGPLWINNIFYQQMLGFCLSFCSGTTVGNKLLMIGFSDDMPIIYQYHKQFLTTSPLGSSSMYIVNSEQLLDFKYFMSICQDSKASSVAYALTFNYCYPKSDPVRHLANYFHIPTFVISQNCNASKSFSVGSSSDKRGHNNMLSPGPGVIIADIVRKLHWKECLIIVDSHQSELDTLLTYLSYLGVRMSVFTVVTQDDIIRVMTQIDSWNTPEHTIPYIVLCEVNNTITILNQAYLLGMRRREYTWLIYNGGSKIDLTPHLLPDDNVALLSINKENVIKKTGFLLEDIQRLNEVINATVEKETPKVGIYGNIASRTVGISASLYRNITAIIQNFEFEHFNSRTREPTYEVHTLVTRGTIVTVMETVATYDLDKALTLSGSLYTNEFYGFNQRVFTVATLEYTFFQHKKYDKDGSYKWMGLTIQLLDELAKNLNFSYVLVEPADGQYGIVDETGNWTGMIGMVARKEVDFAAAPLSVTKEREDVVDFLSPYYHEQSVVITKRPLDQNRLLLYLFPFQREVWLGILAAIVLCGPILWLFTLFSPFYKVNHKPWGGRKGLYSLHNCWTFMFGATVQQGGPFLPESQSGRVFVGCFWMFCMVISATYTGNLIAFLVVSSVDMPFDTLAEMVQQNSISWGTMNGVALDMLFRGANFEPYTSVYAGMDPVESYSEGIQRVYEDNYAFLTEKTFYIAKLAEDRDCVLAAIKEEFYPTNYAWAMQTDDPYVDLFSDKINKIRESGILNKWIQDWTPDGSSNCKGINPVTDTKVATVMEFQGALYLLALGVMSSIVILVAEVVFFRINMAVKQMRQKSKISATSNKPDIFAMTSYLSFVLDGKISENEFCDISTVKI